VITLIPRYDTGLHFEKKYIAANGVATGAIEYEHYLYAGGQMFGKYITATATDGVTQASTATEYYSKDNLGSMVAITDATGTVTQRMSYDIWGKRRYPNGFVDAGGLLNNPDMVHGFTGHEMLDDFELIHMNGRLYDPVMARFVSADFMIPDAADLQYYNRYSYVGNNPLAFTDASGQCPWCIYAIVGAVVGRAAGVIDTKTARGIIGIAVGAWMGPAAFGNGLGNAMLTGGIVGGITGGTQGAINGALTAGLFHGAGFVGGADSLERYVAHAAVGCVSAAAGGGDCARGSLSAVAGKWASNQMAGMSADYQFVAATVTGGVTSVLGGGKFQSGAMTAAFGYMFNAAAEDQRKADAKEIAKIKALANKVKEFGNRVIDQIDSGIQVDLANMSGTIAGGIGFSQTTAGTIDNKANACVVMTSCILIGPIAGAAVSAGTTLQSGTLTPGEVTYQVGLTGDFALPIGGLKVDPAVANNGALSLGFAASSGLIAGGAVTFCRQQTSKGCH